MSKPRYELIEVPLWEAKSRINEGWAIYGKHVDLRDDERTRLKMRREIPSGKKVRP
jgi:hypothetical protein